MAVIIHKTRIWPAGQIRQRGSRGHRLNLHSVTTGLAAVRVRPNSDFDPFSFTCARVIAQPLGLGLCVARAPHCAASRCLSRFW